MEHKNVRQYSDNIVCQDCGKIWDINDPDPPKCEISNDIPINVEPSSNQPSSVVLVGVEGISYFVAVPGKRPNFFRRLMYYLFFGIKFQEIKPNSN